MSIEGQRFLKDIGVRLRNASDRHAPKLGWAGL